MRLAPEGERCCVDTIARKSWLGIALAGPVQPYGESGDPLVQGAVPREVAAFMAGVAFALPAQPKLPLVAIPEGGPGMGTEDVVPTASGKAEPG